MEQRGPVVLAEVGVDLGQVGQRADGAHLERHRPEAAELAVEAGRRPGRRRIRRSPLVAGRGAEALDAPAQLARRLRRAPARRRVPGHEPEAGIAVALVRAPRERRARRPLGLLPGGEDRLAQVAAVEQLGVEGGREGLGREVVDRPSRRDDRPHADAEERLGHARRHPVDPGQVAVGDLADVAGVEEHEVGDDREAGEHLGGQVELAADDHARRGLVGGDLTVAGHVHDAPVAVEEAVQDLLAGLLVDRRGRADDPLAVLVPDVRLQPGAPAPLAEQRVDGLGLGRRARAAVRSGLPAAGCRPRGRRWRRLGGCRCGGSARPGTAAACRPAGPAAAAGWSPRRGR